MNYLAFSGGADSTSMALRLADLGEEFTLLHTPTGDEMPGVAAHVAAIVERIGRPIVFPANRPLADWMEEFQAIPNPRQRWCTRLTKIAPCIVWLKANPGSVLMVGLRADEPEREGLYGEFATYRYPLREWGWTRRDVLAYLKVAGIAVPQRTDCYYCPYQKIHEWRDLLLNHPDLYAKAEAIEARYGHTFRSDARDSWPAGLAELREAFGKRAVRGEALRRQVPLFDEDEALACRVCRA